MTFEDAVERLSTMCAADSEPVLTTAEVEQLANLARRADREGRIITDPEWQPTFDLNAAAAEGWRWKAGKAAGDVTFTSDNQSFSLSHLIEHCERMVRMYSSRRAYTIPVTSGMTAPRTEV